MYKGRHGWVYLRVYRGGIYRVYIGWVYRREAYTGCTTVGIPRVYKGGIQGGIPRVVYTREA